MLGGAIFDASQAFGNVVSHRDWLGSVRVAFSLGHTQVLDAAYTSCAEKYASFGSGPVNFTGEFQDLYSGLYDTPNREFDTSLGSRWLSSDLARASWNAYAYPTNPNSFINPWGFDTCSVHQERWNRFI
ncbi:MAG: RHS repeat-associated core domain-containing protein [Acidobacteriaceae bacterium]